MNAVYDKLLEDIFNKDIFKSSPPVLVDIGASGYIHNAWKDITKFSIGIAFDADDRDMDFIRKESSQYKELYVYNSIVTDSDLKEVDFYLTHSPYCSSVLEPDESNLSLWSFYDLFQITKKIKAKARNLQSILSELKIEQVDWFKTDSQGTDLRLFSSLGKPVIDNVIIADFEPGIIDAYKQEDKLSDLMKYMESLSFWMSDLEIRGSQRIEKSLLDLNRRDELTLKISPGWGEISYINSFKGEGCNTPRNLLLGWAFSTLKKQHGFALELATRANENSKDPIIEKLINFSLNQLYKQSSRSFKTRFVKKMVTLLEKI
jgi:hypothetical protein